MKLLTLTVLVLSIAATRFFRLSFKELDAIGNPTGNARPFNQIGCDGGFLQTPVELTELILAPGERADVIVDFTELAPSMRIQLCNDAEYPFKGGNSGAREVTPDLDGRVMCFDVVAETEADASKPVADLTLPHDLPADTDLRVVAQNDSTVAIIKHILTEVLDGDKPMPLLDNRSWSCHPFDEVKAGALQIWEIENQTEDTHPIHLHLVQFRVLDRIRQDSAGAWVTTPTSPPSIA